MKAEEIWKPVKGYEEFYEVSNLGRVKSHYCKCGVKDRILKPGTAHGYSYVVLVKSGQRKNIKIHKLVAESFLGYVARGLEIVINHKNFIRTDNRPENLEIVTQRENSNKKHIPHTSKYTGVFFDSNQKKWTAAIYANGKINFLGRFKHELEAFNAYQKALLKLTPPSHAQS